MARMATDPRRRALLLALPGAVALLRGAPARAHSEVSQSTPAEGAVLAAPPTAIRLVFSQPMQVSSLRLFDAANRETPLRREGARTAQVGEIRAEILATALPPGEYRIEYRGISADGHVGGGVLRFRVGP